MNRGEIYRWFARQYGWPAQVVSSMTPAQQFMYLSDGRPARAEGTKFQTVEEARAFIRQLGS